VLGWLLLSLGVLVLVAEWAADDSKEGGGLHAWEMVRQKNYHGDNAATAVVHCLVPTTLVLFYLLTS
jgi:hypothetical protein